MLLNDRAVIQADQIQVDPFVRPRQREDERKVEVFRELYEAGVELPPVVVFRDDDNKNVLADGHPRLRAQMLAGRGQVVVKVYRGTKHDAAAYALLANSSGTTLTSQERRLGALKMIGDSYWADWTDTTIARYCGLSSRHVGHLRRGNTAGPAGRGARQYKTKGGQNRSLRTENLGRKAKKSPVLRARVKQFVHDLPWPALAASGEEADRLLQKEVRTRRLDSGIVRGWAEKLRPLAAALEHAADVRQSDSPTA